MEKLVSYFAKNHLLSHVLFFGVMLMAVFAWNDIGKEEMPEFESNWIRVTTIYPGAPAEDVELFVTKELEEELKGVVGIEELQSTSSVGVSSLRITLDDDYPDKDQVTQDIKDAILRTNLPAEVRDIPRIRQFKSAEKAILDIGLYFKGKRSLSIKERQELQKYVLSFESQILALREVSSVSKSYYLKPELQILADPKKILKNQISLSEIKSQIQKNHVRVPIGSMKDKGESKITALNELENVESLQETILRGNYEGEGILLKDIAHIQDGFESSNSIFKINGHEGVFLNIRKNVSTDILTAQAAVKKFIERFKRANEGAPIGIVLMDDESYDVVNRLDIVSKNGIMGFFLIVLVLFVFLNAKSGFWVAMGIPFCISFTLIVANIFGYTINNMTLAGIIIVLGIVVDDAIIIAENISRHIEHGMDKAKAAVVGTLEVVKPIVASIITTCVAFMPLMYFEGFFGKLVAYIPLVVILMLMASLIESIFILPAHMTGKTYIIDRFNKDEDAGHWFHKVEKKYENVLNKIFKIRVPLLIFCTILLGAALYEFDKDMKFVMFPREESKEVFIKVKAKKGFTREETAKAIQPLEDLLVNNTKNIVGVRATIGQSRRGGEVRENEASILAELIPADDRPDSLNKLIKQWEEKSKEFKDLEKVRILRGRWGHSSGSAIELQIQENNDEIRNTVAKALEEKMKANSNIVDVEIEEPIIKTEYIFNLNQRRLIQYDVDPSSVATTLRSFVEGSILYSINKGEEEVDVRLSVADEQKRDLSELLNLRVRNNNGQHIFLRNIVEIKDVKKPVNINRHDFKRTTMIYGNPKPGSKATPLQIAENLEEQVFPDILKNYPTTVLKFKGEIEDTRESQGEFTNSIIFVLIVIYMILVIMFNSLGKPFLVLSIVPVGVAGVIFVLIVHGMGVFGFFAAIGALGMIGVVINDAIVMIDKIEKTFENHQQRTMAVIARVASTRLRPILVTTLTTVVGVLPTAYGVAGYDSMLAEMMLTMGWGLVMGTIITLVLIPTLYTFTAKKEV